MKIWLLKNYNILLDDNSKEGLDTTAISSGYIFDRILSSDSSEILNELEKTKITKLVTLFNEDDTLLDKVVKTILEYTFYNIPKNFHTVKQVCEEVKFIKVLNKEEFIKFCNELVKMNKALESSILKEISEYITLDVSEINNKELKLFYIEKLLKEDKYVNGYELIRYINYLLTGSTLFINFRKKYAKKDMEFKNVDSVEKLENIVNIFSKYERELSKYYNLYRDFFVHIKLWAKRNVDYFPNFKNYVSKDKEINGKLKVLINKINRITRFSKTSKQVKINLKYDKDILKENFETQKKFYEGKSLKELLKLLNYFTMENYYTTKGFKSYKIRNGNNFVKEYSGSPVVTENYLPIFTVIREKILDKFSEVKTVTDFMGNEYEVKEQKDIILPKLFTTPLLLSDKKRSNGVYYKSLIELQENDSIGIIWEEDIDIDLSLLLSDGRVLSWNNDFLGDNCLKFSGDMTSAGSEYFTFVKLKDVEGYLRANLYYDDYDSNSNFSIFIERNGKIIYKSDLISFSQIKRRQITIGYVRDKKFFLDVFGENNDNVAYVGNKKFNRENFLIQQPVPTLEELLDYLKIPYKKLDTTELGNENYSIFE